MRTRLWPPLLLGAFLLAAYLTGPSSTFVGGGCATALALPGCATQAGRR
ncbi:MAG: hypothetical protein V4472_14865 [Pseudomonadota bacterium]